MQIQRTYTIMFELRLGGKFNEQDKELVAAMQRKQNCLKKMQKRH